MTLRPAGSPPSPGQPSSCNSAAHDSGNTLITRAENEWGVEPAVASSLLCRMFSEWSPMDLAQLSPEERVGLAFLYTKHLLACELPSDRRAMFKEIVRPRRHCQWEPELQLSARGVQVDGTGSEAGSGRRDRLLSRILGEPVDVALDSLPPTWHSQSQLTQDLPEWGDSEPSRSSVFFRRDVVPGSMVVRAHADSDMATNGQPEHEPSFLVAPGVVAYYRLCLHINRSLPVTGAGQPPSESPPSNSGCNGSSMVDLTAFMQRHVHPADLWSYVYESGGGHAVGYLEQLAGMRPGGVDIFTMQPGPYGFLAPGADVEVVGHLERHGPALIRLEW